MSAPSTSAAAIAMRLTVVGIALGQAGAARRASRVDPITASRAD